MIKQIEPLLISSEIIISTYKTIRDYVVFTSKRVIAINVQGITGAKKDYTSLPYSKIQAYSVETAGTFDLDSELEMYFSRLGKVKFDFKGSSDIIKIGQIISEFVL
ncbi:PH domain-containing protein [Clostridium botulinum]|nr:PH domain-containing protein [Clostridium botulinum]KON12007.1 cytoplasmic protein [Clostridium botulinum]MBY6985063.1 PH domain-containing protein [Clostridium botulinum]NFH00637.1 PH domain-containing protein [Clostridium botulinum]NFP41212.1 PH domain-containing protein [Clostridium botulinum]